MTKDLSVSILLDFYGEMLTDKQREVVDFYYNEDLSLAEIAEHTGITRQGVRDSIKRGESTLFEMERRLGLVEKFVRTQQGLDEIQRLAQEILDINHRMGVVNEIEANAGKILDLVIRLND